MRAMFGWLSAFISMILMPAAASAQAFPRQIAAPPEDVRTGLHDLPSPENTGLRSPSAMLPVRFTRDEDGLVARITAPVDQADLVRVMLLGPSSDRWTATVTTPAAPPMSLDSRIERADAFADHGVIDLHGAQRPATAHTLLNRRHGPWIFEIRAPAGEAPVDADAGYLLLRTSHPDTLDTHLNTHRLLVDQSIGLSASVRTPEGRPSEVVIEKAQAVVRFPDGAERAIPMWARAGVMTVNFTPDTPGEHRVALRVHGRHADGRPFVRTSQHAFPVLPDQIEIARRASLESDAPGIRHVRIPLARADRDTPVIASAEVWAAGAGPDPVPVCWLSAVCDPRAEQARAPSVSLALDERWLALAGVTEGLELRNVRIQCVDTAIPLATADRLPMALEEPIAPARFAGPPTRDMLIGRPRADRALPIRNSAAAARARAFAGHNLMLVHGYCSTGVWPVSHFTGGLEVFLDANQNRSHDAFANLILDFGNGSKSFGIVAHSQGGAAALHLYTYYFSGLDWAEGPRLLQSVGTPYQGTPLAGNLAVLGDLFGAGCGTNFDLSTEGAALWLAGIPSWARTEVHYWTTSFEDGFGFDYCELVSDFFLADPDDGVIERARGQLPGANNMGHVEGWCHSQGMRDPAQYLDIARNVNMNANAAR